MKRLALLLCLLSLPSAAVTTRASCAVGTSLTYGYSFESVPYPARLETLSGTPVVNLGIGFDRIASIHTRWQLYCKPFPYRRLVLEGGTNDLDLDGTTGAALWLTVKSFIEEAQANGQQVVLVLIPPRGGSSGWTAGEETERLAFNSAARDYQATHPTLILIDSDGVLGDGAVPPALQTAYDYGDHLHLKAAGMQALAAAIAATF